jgi:hypothetical protein
MNGPQFHIPIAVPVVLVLILAAATVVFVLLVRQSTVGRRRLELRDWAGSNAFSGAEGAATIPEPLRKLCPSAPAARWLLDDGEITIVDVVAPEPADDAPAHLLLRGIASSWPTTVLRPATPRRSVFDQLALETMPVMTHGERFIIYGQQHAAAAALHKSAIRALLPPDVGLLLDGQHMVLDFSHRPFDPISLWRMDALAEQLAAHLPATGQTGPP